MYTRYFIMNTFYPKLATRHLISNTLCPRLAMCTYKTFHDEHILHETHSIYMIKAIIIIETLDNKQICNKKIDNQHILPETRNIYIQDIS